MLLRRFRDDCRGALAIVFGFAVVVVTLFIGLAIDTARVFSVTQKVQNALDAAAVEGAKLMSLDKSLQGQLQQRAYNAFLANTASLSNTEALLTNFSAVADTANQIVNVTVHINVPTVFAKLAGLSAFNFNKLSITGYSDVKLEVVLALDITGSMDAVPAGDTRTKMASMKSAAADLVGQFFDGATSDDSVRISVVPWAAGVNVGAYQRDAMGTTSGPSCAVERSGSGATDDSVPGPGSWAQPMPAGNSCSASRVSGLEGRQRRSQIVTSIGSLSSASWTAGHIGMAWAWYMVSPNWASIHPEDNRPQPRSRNVIKAVILMTDGEFNTSHVGGVTSTVEPNEQSYAMFQQICSGMKDQDIRVYTIAFAMDQPRAVSELGTCATSGTAMTPANYSELRDAFSQTLAQLQSLRIMR